MAHVANLPAPLSMEGNLHGNWTNFINQFEIYWGASGREKSQEELPDEAAKKRYNIAQGKTLLNIAGEEAAAVADTFGLAEDLKFHYEELVKKFNEYVKTEVNDTYVRFIFNRTKQEEGQTFDNFLTDLKKKIKPCGFGEMANDLLRDRIVEGIIDSRLQEALLRVKNLKLEDTIRECRAAEQSKQITKEFQSGKNVVAESVKIKQPEDRRGKNCPKCNRRHKYGQCPAWGKRCAKCNRFNHFKEVCRSKEPIPVHSLNFDKEGQGNQEDAVVFSECIEIVESVDFNTGRTAEYRQKVKVCDRITDFKLDPGTSASILPTEEFKRMKTGIVPTPVKVWIKPFGKSTPVLKTAGAVVLPCSAGKVNKLVRFLISDDADRPLWSLQDSEDFGFITRHVVDVDSTEQVTWNSKEELIKEYQEVFQGLGKFPGQHSIITDPAAQQVVRPALRKPRAVMDKLKPALDKLESKKVIEKVDSITPECWVSNMVIVTKPNGELRICLDPHDLNKAIIREPYLIPTFQEISEKLAHQKYFSLFDLKDGFYHIELNEASSKKCCFATPYGIYRFKRLPFGVANAPELFQKLTEQVFSGIPNVVIYFDDILATGKTQQEHDLTVKRIMQRAKQASVKFNPEKVKFRQLKVKYVGHVHSEQGVEPDPSRISDLIKLPNPTNKEELQSVMGMFEYVRPFIPNMSKVAAILYDLKKKNIIWNWTEAHTAAFETLKKIISTSPVMANFDPKKSITIQSDASQGGLGCALLQDGHPVAVSSRRLSESELNYSVSEKEMLGICFAAQKFHNYIFGYPVHVQTDHQPLIPMFTKEVHKLGSKTLQRLRLKLLKYNLKVSYIPGKKMYIADLFSRKFNQEPVEDDQTMLETVHSMSSSLPISTTLAQELSQATKEDQTLQQVIAYMTNGWPLKNTQIQDQVIPYFKIRNELFREDGLLLVNSEESIKIVVPTSQRTKMLKIIHAGHMQIEKNRLRAKEVFFWPGMIEDVTNYVKACTICQKYQPMPQKHPLHPHQLPKLMWERVSIDHLSFGGSTYLCMYDAYSKWLEILKVSTTSAAAAINAMKTVCSTHGYPKVVVADNSPFNSHEFKKFLNENQVSLCNTSPNFPSSNGRAEKGVQIAKNILKKTKEERSDFRDALMEYRNTKVPHMGASPAQLMFSRKIRSSLPISDKDLKPKLQTAAAAKLQKQQERTITWYNRRAKRAEVEPRKGEEIMVKTPGRPWEKGTIKSKCQEPRSYIVSTARGDLRRTTTHMKQIPDKTMKPNQDQIQPDHDYHYLSIRLNGVGKNQIPTPETIEPETIERESTPETTEVAIEEIGTASESEETEELEYAILVPDWLEKLTEGDYVTRSGRISKAVIK